ncbi:hypothetical protein P689_122162 [Candidatus Riesia pediculischaeffi PTSU]|uniref:Uncharacterized protein n=1 Tax=Candidatus Riesia pediculischaeffi PTSU TaxID=1401651 RepID=A0A0C1V818_9ENTR|nr:hypothetical protein P689_122162 [Candidatus Riesia pediculischaeffi PTSU]
MCRIFLKVKLLDIKIVENLTIVIFDKAIKKYESHKNKLKFS